MTRPAPARRNLTERHSQTADRQRGRSRKVALALLGALSVALSLWWAGQRTELWPSDLDDPTLSRRLSALQPELERTLEFELGVVPVRGVTNDELAKVLLRHRPKAGSAGYARRQLDGLGVESMRGWVTRSGELEILINRNALLGYNSGGQCDGPAIRDLVLIHEAVHVYQRRLLEQIGDPYPPGRPEDKYLESTQRNRALRRVLAEGHADYVTLELGRELGLGHAILQYDRRGDVSAQREASARREEVERREREAPDWEASSSDLSEYQGRTFVRAVAERVGIAEVFPFLLRHPPAVIHVLRPARYLQQQGL